MCDGGERGERKEQGERRGHREGSKVLAWGQHTCPAVHGMLDQQHVQVNVHDVDTQRQYLRTRPGGGEVVGVVGEVERDRTARVGVGVGLAMELEPKV